MQCEIHRGDIGKVLVLLPIQGRFGNIDTMACLECAEKSDVYCNKHHLPHGHWGMNMSRCHACALEILELTLWERREIFERVRRVAPDDLMLLAEERCPPFLTYDQKLRSLLYFFVSSALALKTDVDQLIRRIEEDRSMDFLKNESMNVL